MKKKNLLQSLKITAFACCNISCLVFHFDLPKCITTAAATSVRISSRATWCCPSRSIHNIIYTWTLLCIQLLLLWLWLLGFFVSWRIIYPPQSISTSQNSKILFFFAIYFFFLIIKCIILWSCKLRLIQFNVYQFSPSHQLLFLCSPYSPIHISSLLKT